MNSSFPRRRESRKNPSFLDLRLREDDRLLQREFRNGLDRPAYAIRFGGERSLAGSSSTDHSASTTAEAVVLRR
jgi:hypothetical protein